MAGNFSFPDMSPAEIAEALHTYDIAPHANLRAEDITNAAPDLLAGVLALFLSNIVGEDLDQQLGFEALAALDNPELHLNAIQVMRLYRRGREFLESIEFRGFTLRDITGRPDPRRVIHVLSALINFLHFRQEKLALLQPIVEEFPNSDERRMELKAIMAENQAAIDDHLRKEQMEAPAIQQLEVEVNSLKQKIQEYNKEQLTLRGKAKEIDEEKDAIRKKISKAEFELLKQNQENSNLLSKLVQSPEKLQRALEEKKAARAELKNLQKMAMQNVQEKTNTLEMYTKAHEKLSKHSSKISALQEQIAAAKAAEKEVKALKTKMSDRNVELVTLEHKIVDWQQKVHETKELLKAKEKEKDQRIGENSQKIATLKSEIECKLKSLEDTETEVEEKISKGAELCSQADKVAADAAQKQKEIFARYDEVCNAANHYMDNIDRALDSLEQEETEAAGQIVSSIS